MSFAVYVLLLLSLGYTCLADRTSLHSVSGLRKFGWDNGKDITSLQLYSVKPEEMNIRFILFTQLKIVHESQKLGRPFSSERISFFPTHPVHRYGNRELSVP